MILKNNVLLLDNKEFVFRNIIETLKLAWIHWAYICEGSCEDGEETTMQSR